MLQFYFKQHVLLAQVVDMDRFCRKAFGVFKAVHEPFVLKGPSRAPRKILTMTIFYQT